MVCLFQPLIKSPSVHEGRVSDLLSCILGPPSLCEEITALAAAIAPHPGLPRPSSPSASAGQPQKRWLDSRKAPILQPRQSRLHRWVTIKHASRPPLPLNCFRDEKHRLVKLWGLVFGNVFCACLASCVHFSFKRSIFSGQACSALKHTKQRCQRAQEEPWGVCCVFVFQAHWLVWFWLQVSSTELCLTRQLYF